MQPRRCTATAGKACLVLCGYAASRTDNGAFHSAACRPTSMKPPDWCRHNAA
jgi:hypothetical protein